MNRRLRKITLKMLTFFFVFSLGFILSELRFTYQLDNSLQCAWCGYEDIYTMLEREFSEKTGLPLESPEVEEYMAEVRTLMEMIGQPLVAVGPFVVFVNHEGDKFSVHEMQSVKQEKGLLLPLVELKGSEASKSLHFTSSAEKGGRIPRFFAQLVYSEDGIYEKSNFSVHKDGTFERIYYDDQGIGVFNRMVVFENGMMNTYSLNELSWEKTGTATAPDRYLSLQSRAAVVQPVSSDLKPPGSDADSGEKNNDGPLDKLD